MSQLFGRTKPNKADETIQRTKEKIIDLTKSVSDRQRYLKQLIGMKSFPNPDILPIEFHLQINYPSMIYKHFSKVHINIFSIFFSKILVKLKVILHEHVCDRKFHSIETKISSSTFLVSKQNQIELEYVTNLLEVNNIFLID